MHDFDPRSFDAARDDGRGARADRSVETGRDLSRGGRGASDSRDREHADPRDAFMSQVDLPRGLERVRVHERDHEYMLRGSESRALTTVGAFRVVPAGDLRDGQDRPLDPRRGDLYHLRKSGLVQTIPALGRDRALVLLTERGRALLEANRHPSTDAERPCPAGERDTHDARQEFYAGLRTPKELTHDAQVYRAHLRAAGQLCQRGSRVRRVVVDYELKRAYQQFLHERQRGRSDSDGRPDRASEEIRSWALAHDLPHEDGHVQFPDARIEYEDVDGRLRTEDIEVTTVHYRGGHLAAKAAAGFSCYRGSGVRIVRGSGRGSYGSGGRQNGSRGGRGVDPRIAEELLG
jgi:hypothetical protein